MLIQSDPKTGEPLLLSSTLPECVKSAATSKDVRVLLLDSQVRWHIRCAHAVADAQMGTGAAASKLTRTHRRVTAS